MKVLLESYGCTMNRGEAMELASSLLADGQTIAGPDETDFERAIIYTCCVIEATELKMLKRIRELASQNKEIVVCGCLGAIAESEILKFAPNAMIFTPPNHDKAHSQLCKKIDGSAAENEGSKTLKRGVSSNNCMEQLREGALIKLTPSTENYWLSPYICKPEGCSIGRSASSITDAIGIIPIASGCLGECTYCITRFARGQLVSRSPKIVVEKAGRLISAGAREIQITAQDTGVYGSDIGSNLPELLEELAAIEGNHIFRVGMMTPNSALSNLERLVASFESPRIFKFLHLPLQSGSDRMLAAMGRKYNVADFRLVIEAFRSRIPDITLSTDIIVGFPGETDADFEATIKVISDIRPDIVNVTRFSARPGTLAATMPEQVHGRIAKERSRILTKLRFEISAQINQKYHGRQVDALAVEYRKEGTTFFRAVNYRPVVVKGVLPLGRWSRLEITGSGPTHLFGRPLQADKN